MADNTPIAGRLTADGLPWKATVKRMGYESKIVDRPALLQRVAQLRREKKAIVCCHGCFDIVHPGHLRYLQFAKRQGDVLVVSMTGDACIEKGAQRPFIPEELRAENLAALELVDLVTIDSEPTAAGLLNALRPDVYVKGREYQDSEDPRFLEERRIVEDAGGRVIFSSGDVVFSSTQLIESMGPQPELEASRLTFLCQRHRLDEAALLKVTKDMAGRRVIVVGDVVLDRYVFCDPINVASESPMMALKRLGEESYWGGAAIVARHVAALGGRAFLLSAAGEGERAEQAAASLTAEGVEHRFIKRRGEIVAKTRFLVETSKLLKVEDGDANPLDTLAQREAASILHEVAADADAIVFCDFGYGTLSGTWVERSIASLREKVGVMVADVSGDRANLLRFQKMDLLSPTERELRTSVNDFGRGLATVAWQVMNTAACRHLIVTLGQRGAVVFDRQSQDPADPKYRERLRSDHVPALGQIEMDRLGCGDALTATAALSLSAGATLMQAAYLGSASAALELRRMGNVPIHRRTLTQFLASRRELHCGLPPSPPLEHAQTGEAVTA